eukprot:523401-Prymnesium_polylepis.1
MARHCVMLLAIVLMVVATFAALGSRSRRRLRPRRCAGSPARVEAPHGEAARRVQPQREPLQLEFQTRTREAHAQRLAAARAHAVAVIAAAAAIAAAIAARVGASGGKAVRRTSFAQLDAERGA